MMPRTTPVYPSEERVNVELVCPACYSRLKAIIRIELELVPAVKRPLRSPSRRGLPSQLPLAEPIAKRRKHHGEEAEQDEEEEDDEGRSRADMVADGADDDEKKESSEAAASSPAPPLSIAPLAMLAPDDDLQ